MLDIQPRKIDLALLSSLYTAFAEDLRAVRAKQADLYRQYRGHEGGEGILSRVETPSRFVTPEARQWISNHVPLKILIQARRISKALVPGRDLDPQSDDIDCEIAYLLIRLARPRTIVEISPCGGWSTTWLLSGIQDANQGHLYSYDLIDDALRTVPRWLAADRWTFLKGDIRKWANSIPTSIDYLFLDAEHSTSFARWYIDVLIPKLSPNAIVTIDDIFHPELERRGETGESKTVLSWLSERGIPYFTAAPSANPNTFDQLVGLRRELGFEGQIHSSVVNPSIFFRVPGS
jgi:predicted O-methyltransferase YrrM